MRARSSPAGTSPSGCNARRFGDSVLIAVALCVYQDSSPVLEGGEMGTADCLTGLMENPRLISPIKIMPSWMLRIGPGNKLYQTLSRHMFATRRPENAHHSVVAQNSASSSSAPSRPRRADVPRIGEQLPTCGSSRPSNTPLFLTILLALHQPQTNLAPVANPPPSSRPYDPTLQPFRHCPLRDK